MAVRFIVKVKKHQDRNGNTYHNAKVRDLRLKRTYTTGVTYGYGTAYNQTINKMLKKKGLRTKLSYSNSDVSVTSYKTMKAIKSF